MQPSLYFWRVRYSDGDVVTSDSTPYDQIDRTRLRQFEIVHRATRKSFGLTFRRTDRLIWRKREQLRTDGTRITYHLIVSEPKAGAGPAFIKLLSEADGSVELYEHFHETDPRLIEPERLPCELANI